jgi:hypothetical protein
VFAIAVLPAIEFDDQSMFPAKEINNVRTDRNLPYELMSVQSTIAKFTPKPVLGLGVIGA